MISQCLRLLCLLLGAVTMVGCGGGSSKSPAMSRSTVRERAIATTRVARATFALAGLGRHITRAPHTGMGRTALFLAALHHTRDAVTEGKDADTGLFFTLTTAADGSGQQNLFTDAAHTHAAGRYAWNAPQWPNGQPDTYPVLLHEDFQVTDGTFKGAVGTADSTLSDASGNNGKIHMTFTDAMGETAVCDLTIDNGMVHADDKVTLPDQTTFDEQDISQTDGSMQCTFIFPDGSKDVEIMAPDGTGTETLTDSNGTVEESGTFQDTGMETLNYQDGSSETVNVDTADTSTGNTATESSVHSRTVRPRPLTK